MTVELDNSPEKTKELRAKVADLAKLQSASEQAITEAIREGDLDQARSVLEQASLAVREYEDFRKDFTPEEILLAKYGVEVINDHTVLFVIPKGVSRIEILEEVQGLIEHTDGGPFIDPFHLEQIKKIDRYSSKQSTSKRLCIDGHVPGGDAKGRGRQEAFLGEEFAMANSQDLVVAFSLYWLATGEPLFGWYNEQKGLSYTIRCVGSSLRFFGGILRPDHSNGGQRNADATIGVSACVSPE